MTHSKPLLASNGWTSDVDALSPLRELIQQGWGLAWFSRRYAVEEPCETLLPAVRPWHDSPRIFVPGAFKPATRLSLDDVVDVYEEYADLQLGRVKFAERHLVRLFGDEEMTYRWFGPHCRPPAAWWMPAARMVLLAAALCDKPVEVDRLGRDGHTISVDTGTYYLSAAPDRIFRNMTGEYQRKPLAIDCNVNTLNAPATTWKHPLASLLARLDAHSELLQLANAALQKRRGRINPVELFDLNRPLKAEKVERQMTRDEVSTIAHVRGMLDERVTTAELFPLLVPRFMNHREFRGVVGDLRNENPLKSPAVARTLAYLENLERKALAITP